MPRARAGLSHGRFPTTERIDTTHLVRTDNFAAADAKDDEMMQPGSVRTVTTTSSGPILSAHTDITAHLRRPNGSEGTWLLRRGGGGGWTIGEGVTPGARADQATSHTRLLTDAELVTTISQVLVTEAGSRWSIRTKDHDLALGIR